MALQRKVGTFTIPQGTTGNQSVTLVGFQPELVEVFSVLANSASQDHGHFFYGAAVSATKRWCYSTTSQDNVGDSDAHRGFTNTAFMRRGAQNGGAVVFEADFVSMDTDGFTYNISDDEPSAGVVVTYIAYAGTDINFDVGSIDLATSPASQPFTGVGFQPKALKFVGGINGTASTIQAGGGAFCGFTDGTNQYVNFICDEDGQNFSDVSEYSSLNACIAMALDNDSTAIDYEASITSMNADGFTLNVSNLPAAITKLGYIAYGGSALSVEVGKGTARTGSPGNEAYTTTIEPKFLFIIHQTAPAGEFGTLQENNGQFHVGASDGTAGRSSGYTSQDNQNNSNVFRHAESRVYLSSAAGSGSVLSRATVQAFNALDFTLNFSEVAGTAYDFGWMVFADAAVADAITVDPITNLVHPVDPADDQILAGSLTISGTLSGPTTVDHVQARIMDGVTEVITWTTIDAAPAGGSFSGVFNDIPAGDGYNVEVRSREADTTVIATDIDSNTWGVGYLVAILGQSNARRMFDNGTAETRNALSKHYQAAEDVWDAAGNVGNGSIALCNFVATGITGADTPVGLVGDGYNGDEIADFLSGDPNYVDFSAAVNAVGGAIHGFIWLQGGRDAILGTSQSVYEGRLHTDADSVIKNVRADFTNAMTTASNIPVLVMIASRREDGAATDAAFQAIRAAQRRIATTVADCYVGPDLFHYDLSDQVHFTDAAMSEIGKDLGQWFLTLIGEETEYLGPDLIGLDVQGDAFTLTVAHNHGTDFTPAAPTDADGFSFLDDGSPLTVATGPDRASATTLTGTFATSPKGLVTARVGFGADPDHANWVESNSARTQGLSWLESLRVFVLDLATETDSALTITPALAPVIALGLVTETDSVSAITPSQGLVVVLGLPTETDSALGINPTFAGIVALGLVEETDSVLPILPSMPHPIGLVTETDSALAITPNLSTIVAIGLATETDSALAITPFAPSTVVMGVATETDTALPITLLGQVAPLGLGYTAPLNRAHYTLRR